MFRSWLQHASRSFWNVSPQGSCFDESSQASFICFFLGCSLCLVPSELQRRFMLQRFYLLCRPAISKRLAGRSYSMLSAILSVMLRQSFVCRDFHIRSECPHFTCCAAETSEVVIRCGCNSSSTWTPNCSVQDSLLGLTLLAFGYFGLSAVAVFVHCDFNLQSDVSYSRV
jgi:hypothetical protein